MKMLAFPCWRLMSGLLLAMTLTLPGLTRAAEVDATNPSMGELVQARLSGDPANADQEELLTLAAEAARAYRAGDFAAAVNAYEAASRLAPQNDLLKSALEASRQMSRAQEEARRRLPQDSQTRQRQFEAGYQAALFYQENDKTIQAYNGFYTLWLTAGDYNGKTVMMLERAASKLRAEQPALDIASAIAPVDAATVAMLPGDAASVAAPEPVAGDLAQIVPLAQFAGEDEAPAIGLPSGEIDDVTRLRVNRILVDVERLLNEGELDAAGVLLDQVAALWPGNERASELRDRLDSRLMGVVPAEATAAPAAVELPTKPNNPELIFATESREDLSPEAIRTINRMHEEASGAYRNGNLERAREIWTQILQLDPRNQYALTWMEQTETEWNQILQARQEQMEASERRETARQLLNAPITVSTESPIPLTEFMHMLSLMTPTDLEFNVGQGANAMVFANFRNQTLRYVLDSVLLPAGLSWTIDDRNVIQIQQRLISRTFQLNQAQLNSLRVLMANQDLHRLVWGQTEPPSQGVGLTLDERNSILLATGSQQHMEKLEQLIAVSASAPGTELVTNFYKIREADGPKIRALINSVISSRESTMFEEERKLFIDGEDLIIRDTPENIEMIEELLLDQNFIQLMRDDRLDIQSFSLIPENIDDIETDEIEVLTSNIIEAIKVFLYSEVGESEARRQGRRLWYDEATMQLTIVDTPTALQDVAEYINSLPQFGSESRQRVVELRHAVAEDLAGSIERILQLVTDDFGLGTGGGEGTSMRLRRGEERTFRDARIRLIRVEENDIQDRNDDSVELAINTGAQIQNVTVREFETQFIDDYEITADQVQASSGQPGDGSATITIRYSPRVLAQQSRAFEQQLQQNRAQAMFGLAPVQPLPTAGGVQPQTQPSQEPITLTPISELNVIVLRYTDPQMFEEAMDLIRQLDQPVRQVEIQTKFVEVNESRAKEVGGRFDIQGLGSGRSIDWSQQFVNTRFGQDVDQFRSPLDLPLTNPFGPNFINGATVIDAAFGSGPTVNYTLRLLEAEGVLNLVNGPKVLALNGVEAEFRIESYMTTGQEPDAGGFVDIIDPIENANISIVNEDEATEEGDLVGAVVLTVTPEITSESSIILRQLDTEFIDFSRYVNQIVQLVPDEGQVPDGTVFTALLGPRTVSAYNMNPVLKRKRILTDARVTNGGTIVLGGWLGERSEQYTSGVPVLRNMPYLGKMLFSRNQWTRDTTTMMIFLTCNLID